MISETGFALYVYACLIWLFAGFIAVALCLAGDFVRSRKSRPRGRRGEEMDNFHVSGGTR
jgi:hypothetical protein